VKVTSTFTWVLTMHHSILLDCNFVFSILYPRHPWDRRRSRLHSQGNANWCGGTMTFVITSMPIQLPSGYWILALWIKTRQLRTRELSYVCIQRLDEASKLLLMNTSSPLCKGLPPYSLCHGICPNDYSSTSSRWYSGKGSTFAVVAKPMHKRYVGGSNNSQL